MTAREFRIASIAALALAASIMVLPTPAHACSCANAEIDEALAAGRAVAIVTRTDDGSTTDATFAVEDSIGPELPDELEGVTDNGGSCQPGVAVGGTAALVFERRKNTADGLGRAAWTLPACSEVPLDAALRRARGAPVAVDGGPVVAVAAGHYGGSRLAALDERGRVVDWDGLAGSAEEAAVCPGGSTVAAAGDRFPRAPRFELTVHDVGTLRTRRTVALPRDENSTVLAMRCADPQGDRVEVLVVNYNEDSRGILLIVENNKVEQVDLGHIAAATAVSDGFVAIADGILTDDVRKPPLLVRIRPDGTRAVLSKLAGSGLWAVDRLAVSPDEKTVAIFGYREGKEPSPLVTIDAGTGERLGEWVARDSEVGGLAWTAAGRLLVQSTATARPPVPTLRVFDRTLRPLGRRTPGPGGFLTTVGEAAVTYLDKRMAVTPEAGEPLVLDELRLVSTEDVVAVPDRVFAVGDATGTRSAEPAVAVADEPGSSVGPVVAGLAGVCAVGAAAMFASRRRRRA